MRIAVLGVGLIGGSIGLAARARLDAEVAGFDPDGSCSTGPPSSGRSTPRIESAAAAVEGAELVFCAAPVTALPGLAAEALDAAGEDCAVTDVGSVKRDVIAALGSDSRFIGGHPLAGAETVRRGERPRGPLRGRPLVPDADRRTAAECSTTACSERSPRWAPGPRRSRRRPTTA